MLDGWMDIIEVIELMYKDIGVMMADILDQVTLLQLTLLQWLALLLIEFGQQTTMIEHVVVWPDILSV
jgi:hypothetical protein